MQYIYECLLNQDTSDSTFVHLQSSPRSSGSRVQAYTSSEHHITVTYPKGLTRSRDPSLSIRLSLAR